MNRLRGIALVLAFVACQAFSALAKPLYVVVSNPQPIKEAKVEVVEFFWYGCNHCNDLDPKVSAWAKKRNDIVFKRVHVPLAQDWMSMTKTYYALLQMKKLGVMHQRLFDAMHKDNIPIDDPMVLARWLPTQTDAKGQPLVDVEVFKKTYDSFAVQVKAKQAYQLAAAYRLTGVPALVVDGRYLTSGKYYGQEEATTALNQMVAKAKADRKQRGTSK